MKPLGNLYLEDVPNGRGDGLGDLGILDDEQLAFVLSNFTAREVCTYLTSAWVGSTSVSIFLCSVFFG